MFAHRYFSARYFTPRYFTPRIGVRVDVGSGLFRRYEEPHVVVNGKCELKSLSRAIFNLRYDLITNAGLLSKSNTEFDFSLIVSSQSIIHIDSNIDVNGVVIISAETRKRINNEALLLLA